MAEHTKGPWKVSKENALAVVGYSKLDDLNIRIAHCAYGDIIPTEQGQANAALIAAAPDLLEALEDVLDWCIPVKDTERDTLPPMTPEKSAAGAVLRAKAAIRKARKS